MSGRLLRAWASCTRATWAARLAVGLLWPLATNLACGDDADDDPPADTQAATGPVASPPDPEIKISAPSRDAHAAVVHDHRELEALDEIESLDSLDLALSLVDARTRPLPPDAEFPQADQCTGIDLMELGAKTPKLRKLRISGCPALVRAGLQSFGQLRELELADMVLDDVTIARISQLTHLESLSLTRVQATEASTLPLVRALKIRRIQLKELEKESTIGDLLGDLPTLREVRLEGSWAAHRTMLSLGQAKHLQRLELVDTSVGNFSLNQIKSSSELQSVHWVGETFNDNSPLYLRDLPVQSFFCECPNLGDGGVRHLRYVPQIRDLHLERARVSPAGLSALTELVGLERLFLGDQDIDAAALEALAELPKLSELRLEGGLLVDPSETSFAPLTRVTHLSAHLEGIDDDCAASFEPLVQLRSLALGGTAISDDGLVHLAPLVQLEQLELSGTRVTNEGLAHLVGMTRLRELDLSHTDLVDAGVLHLAGLRALQTLDLGHTLVTDAIIDTLLALPALERLGLANTVVTKRGASRLGQHPTLDSIDLRGSRALEP